ncbi:uncharacterized protein Dwil_GK11620 [Drosophila willistoni]|uniref:Uncharacterized protein n=1 Tax=Drosophila willistoni TaxID=7260 RepID=B4N9P5_DROWI|nr:neprilysin-4 [Drosophila willistoni]EDW80610.1 uncharacterized protein Dwil_GK11620 [Drosophila willistoni]
MSPFSFGLLAIIICQTFGQDTLPTSFQRIFQTEDSVRKTKSNEMRSFLNLSADPCTDFYEYACGNWKAIGNPFTQLEQRTDVDLVHLLEDTPHRNDSALARQAKEFYKSCLMAGGQQDHQQQQFLSEFIKQNGGFPAVPGSHWEVHYHSYDWIRVLGKLRHLFGMDILIGLRLGYNYENVQENSIYLSEPNTLIPRELCRNAKKQRLDLTNPLYEALEERVGSELKHWLALGNEESARLATEIITFEHELCGGMQGLEPWDAELTLYEGNYTRKTLAELSHIYGLDLEAYVTASFDKNIYKPVYMAAPDYYRQLQRTVAAHNLSQVANYIMYRAVAALTFPLEDRPPLRQLECLERIKQLLPTGLGELYTRQFGNDEETKRELLELYKYLHDSLKQSISVDWIEEGSRRVALRKLTNLHLWLPEYERPQAYKIHLERSQYWKNLHKLLGLVEGQQQLNRLYDESLPNPNDPLEAYETRLRYRPVQQRLDIGWAWFQPPHYDARYGHAMRYATLGVALAQQMTLAFDDLHWSKGLLERDSWDGLTAWRYHNRTDCFYRQVKEYLQHNVTATKQLIGDSAALNMAFRAYLTWLGFQEPNNDFTRLIKETLPGLNYTNTALFFVAYSQQYCQLEDKEMPSAVYSLRDNHSWTRLKVNGPLSNLPEFSTEFHCALGTPMNPADKCSTY